MFWDFKYFIFSLDVDGSAIMKIRFYTFWGFFLVGGENWERIISQVSNFDDGKDLWAYFLFMFWRFADGETFYDLESGHVAAGKP